MSGEQISAEKEIEAIKQTILDYIESCYEGNAERMASSLHPALAKRTMEPHHETHKKVLRPTSVSMLVENIRGISLANRQLPKEAWQADVIVFDVYDDMATAKVMATTWFDYLHLVKEDDKWLIVNALWRLYEWRN